MAECLPPARSWRTIWRMKSCFSAGAAAPAPGAVLWLMEGGAGENNSLAEPGRRRRGVRADGGACGQAGSWRSGGHVARKLRAVGDGAGGRNALDAGRNAIAAGGMLARPRQANARRWGPMSLRTLRYASHHEWLVAGCLLMLLVLFASAVVGGLPAAGQVDVRLVPAPGAGVDPVMADGRGLRVDG